MLTLEEIKAGLKDKRLTVVAKKIGVSYPRLLALSKGEADNIGYKILQKVSDYLTK